MGLDDLLKKAGDAIENAAEGIGEKLGELKDAAEEKLKEAGVDKYVDAAKEKLSEAKEALENKIEEFTNKADTAAKEEAEKKD